MTDKRNVMGWTETQAAVRLGRRVSQKRINADAGFWESVMEAKHTCNLIHEDDGTATVFFPTSYAETTIGAKSPIRKNYWEAERYWKIGCIKLVLRIYAGLMLPEAYILARLPDIPYGFSIEPSTIKILSHHLRGLPTECPEAAKYRQGHYIR